MLTGGTNTGVMRHVGEALSGTHSALIGVATHGIVTNREQLYGNVGGTKSYEIASSLTSKGAYLDHNHSHHLLVDDGTIKKFGREIPTRSALEKFIMDSNRYLDNDPNAMNVPSVLLVLEGGPGTLGTVIGAIEGDHAIPVVIVKGTGRAADLLAYAVTSVDVNSPDSLNDLNSMVEEIFGPEHEVNPSLNLKKLYDQALLCAEKKHMVCIS